MSKLTGLSMEQELLILASRLTFKDEEKKKIIEYSLDAKLKWFEFFKMALYHKTATLCWNNIVMFAPTVVIPTYLYYFIRYGKREIKLQNEMFVSEFENVLQALNSNNITAIPVKGCRFVKTLYECDGTRFMGDFDLLIRKSDSAKISSIMDSMGYKQGKIDFEKNEILPLGRAEEIKWKMSVSNLAPYYKMTGDECNPFFKFDFRHSLDDNLETESIEKIIDYYENNGVVLPAHLLIHLCTHFYGEAKRTVSIFLSKDFNIIKLTDIREFVLHNMDENEWNIAIDFAKEYALEKHVYFTLYYLSLIFDDGYEEPIMEKLNIENKDFLGSYGDSTLNDNFSSNRTVIDSIFSCSNYQEVSEVPSFLKIDEI